MAVFRYEARDNQGARQRGEVQADDQSAAINQLLARQLTPVRVTRSAERAVELSYKSAAQIASELSRLHAAGVPLETGASLAAPAQEAKAGRLVLERAASRLADGRSAGDAFGGLGGPAGRALSAVMAAGQRSGRLSDALASAAPLFTATARFKERIISLLIYPAAVSVMAIAALLTFMLVIIPNLKPVLLDLGDELPTSTQIMLAASDATPQILIVLCLIVLFVILVRQLPGMAQKFETWRDQILAGPLGFGLPGAIDTALFARLFAALLRAQTPVADAMREAGAAMANSIFRERVERAAARVNEGESVAHSLAAAFGDDSLVVQAARLGSRGTGFADLVAEAGATLSERAELKLERIAALAAPAIIILLGLIIGGLVLSLFSSLMALPDVVTR